MAVGEPQIVRRNEWNSKPPLWQRPLHTPVKYVWTVYTNKNHCYNHYTCGNELRFLQQFHPRTVQNDCPDLRYNFLIGNDARVYEGRGWYVRPTLYKPHGRHSGSSIFIAFMGSFIESPPSDTMYKAREELIKFGIKFNFIQPRHLQIFYRGHEKEVIPLMQYNREMMIKKIKAKLGWVDSLKDELAGYGLRVGT